MEVLFLLAGGVAVLIAGWKKAGGGSEAASWSDTFTFGDPRAPSSSGSAGSTPAPWENVFTPGNSFGGGFEESVVDLFGLGGGMPSHISAAGLSMIEHHEGWSAKPYKDAAGYWTIGYGHKILPGESFTTISKATGRALLAKDAQKAEQAVKDYVKVSLSQGQFDALVSFTYNLGGGALRDSTLLKKLNAGDYHGAALEFDRWTKAGGKVLSGLVARRADEKALFLA